MKRKVPITGFEYLGAASTNKIKMISAAEKRILPSRQIGILTQALCLQKQ